MTHFAAMEDSEVVHKGTDNRLKTFQVSGRAHRVGKNVCGLQEKDAFGVEIREIMIRNPQSNLIVGPTGRLPQRTTPTNPSFRTNRRQNKISSQQTSPVTAAQQFPPLPQQKQTEESASNDTLPPFAPGVRVDLLMDFLKAILSPEDFEKYRARLEPPQKKEETTIYQDLANKDKEHGKILRQVEHQRNVVRDAEAKLHKHRGVLEELLERGQNLKREIDMLRAQVAVAANSAQVVPPMPPPGNPPAGAPPPPPLHSSNDIPSDIQIEEVEEDDELMEEEEEDIGDNGSGVGAFLAPPKKKMVKKTNLKKSPAKGISVKAETRQSVFAKAGMLSARELTCLVEECSALAKAEADDELAEELGGEKAEPAVTMEDKPHDMQSG